MQRLFSTVRRMTSALAAGAILAVPIGASAQSASPGLMGDWYGSGSGVVQLVFAPSTVSNALTLHAYGACSPSPCDWGTVPVTIYAANVGAAQGGTGLATFVTNFSATTLIATLVGTTLRVRTYTRFTDGSGRSNYANIVDLHR